MICRDAPAVVAGAGDVVAGVVEAYAGLRGIEHGDAWSTVACGISGEEVDMGSDDRERASVHVAGKR